MIRIIGTSVLLAVVVACAPSVSKKAAQVAYHSTMSNLLDGCESLGWVSGVVDASWLTPIREEMRLEEMRLEKMRLAELALTEAALKKYNGNVDNVVFITTVKSTAVTKQTRFFAIVGSKVIHASALGGGDTLLVQEHKGKYTVFAVGEAFKCN